MAAIRKWEVKYDDGSFARRPSDYNDVRVLAANTAEAHTVPTGANGLKANYVVFSANADFWVDVGKTAAVPAADITDGTAPDLNPTVLYLGGSVTTISLISTAGGIVGMAFYM